jgi:hypothetical protein
MINKKNDKLEYCIDFLERHFDVAEIKSNYLCELLKSVLLQIIKSTGNKEIDFGIIYEGPTISGEDGEVTNDGDIILNSTKLRKYDDDVTMASIAHELAHKYLEHYLDEPDGLEHEDEADELARNWGFNIDKFREVCGPAILL